MGKQKVLPNVIMHSWLDTASSSLKTHFSLIVVIVFLRLVQV